MKHVPFSLLAFMKQLFLVTLLLFTGTFLLAQNKKYTKPQLLLAGVIHQIPDSLKHNWNRYKSVIDQYRPDAICIEYRMPEDSVSLMHSDGDRYKIILDSLRNAWKINLADEKTRTRELYALLQQSEDWEKRIELYQLLYSNADFGNADFQAWRICNLTAEFPEAEKNKLKADYPVYNKIKNYVNRRKNSEFANVFFPLAVKFNIDYLHPVDEWIYNISFSIACQNGDSATK
jgi:hypothetical protein